MKKVFKILVVLLSILMILLLYVRVEENFYENKFNKVQNKTALDSIKKKWGEPDDDFILDNKTLKRVVKYRKGIIGWSTYIFIFDKDLNLISKHIDD